MCATPLHNCTGAFPLWLAPVQCRLVPVSSAVADYVHSVAADLRTAGLRVEVVSGNLAWDTIIPCSATPCMPNLCKSLAPTSLLLQSTCFALYNAGLSVGKAIRGAETDKVPVMCVIGQREAAEGTVSVRTYADGDMGPMHVQDLLSRLVAANTNKTPF